MPLVDNYDDRVDYDLQNRLRRRFKFDSSGQIIDTTNNESMWLVGVDFWKKWFMFLEEEIGQPLERKLSYASEEHETLRIQNRVEVKGIPKPLWGKTKAQLNWINCDWLERGIGELESLDVNGAKFTGRIFSSLASGQVVSFASKIYNQSFRHLWNDSGVHGTNIGFENRGVQLPGVKEVKSDWIDSKNNTISEIGEQLLNPMKGDVGGTWNLETRRCIFLGRDLLIRLSKNISLSISESSNVDSGTHWEIADDDLKIVWSALSEAAKRAFIDSEEHVLIADDSHWQYVFSDNLACAGLGQFISANSFGENGEVELVFHATVHPAISVGILLGCWQRSEGRDGKVEWNNIGGVHHVKITPKREISS